MKNVKFRGFIPLLAAGLLVFALAACDNSILEPAPKTAVQTTADSRAAQDEGLPHQDPRTVKVSRE